MENALHELKPHNYKVKTAGIFRYLCEGDISSHCIVCQIVSPHL